MTILVGVIMGSKSDWDTMQHAVATLDKLGIAHETRVISAHRTPDALTDYCRKAKDRGLEVIIAAAGGAAALPGAVAALTPLPVLGVPIKAWSLDGLDSLLSMTQMPAGIPVGTLAIGKPGAINSAVLAASILANKHDTVAKALDEFLAIAYWKERRCPTVIARFFNTVGPRQTGRYGMVVPRFIGQALRGDPRCPLPRPVA